ncbi:hypothetical protein EST38_g13136 [Candolleomyces aberdarensis]|uniref:Uncharacterized protein n=1 Tax=Candolleomyces aberdarensis TaxID=2316362 RepID=A0A4Q2D1E6_9AGAR|nr:hypothetical protein EST38_g13136 [Candolleomyces aberdarensis]
MCFPNKHIKNRSVRVMMLITYKNTEQSTVCSTIDYNGKPSLGGKSFLSFFGKQFNDSGIMAMWGAYSKETVVTKDEIVVDPKLARRFGKPLLALELNQYGEPRIPNPAHVPTGEQPNQYLPQVIQNIVIYNYARSCGKEPNHTVPPWSDIVADLHSFIAPEYLADDLAKQFTEPSSIKVGAARNILLFWRARQAENKIPLNIHYYIDDSGSLVPRVPREPLEGLEDLGSDYRNSEEEMPSLVKTKAAVNMKKAGRKGPVCGSGEIFVDDRATVPKKNRVRRKSGKAASRWIVDSDEEEVEGHFPGALGSPFATPPPDTVPASPGDLSGTLPIPLPGVHSPMLDKPSEHKGSLDTELAGLSDDVKRLVLNAIQNYASTVLEPANASDDPHPVPGQALDGPSTFPIKQSNSPLPPVPQPLDPTPIKQSDSPVPKPTKRRKKGKA